MLSKITVALLLLLATLTFAEHKYVTLENGTKVVEFTIAGDSNTYIGFDHDKYGQIGNRLLACKGLEVTADSLASACTTMESGYRLHIDLLDSMSKVMTQNDSLQRASLADEAAMRAKLVDANSRLTLQVDEANRMKWTFGIGGTGIGIILGVLLMQLTK